MTLAVYFALSAGIISCVSSTSINEYAKQFCGGENKCNGSARTSVPKDSCCRPCECDAVCLEKGTCCHDAIVNSSKNVTMQRCLLAAKYPKSYRDKRHFTRYFVRTYCPYSYDNQQIRHKCETDFPDSLNDVPFVSSKDGKIVYKNRHCAVCYGEEDVVAWDLVADRHCTKKAFLRNTGSNLPTNASYIKRRLMNDCLLWFVRPAITDVRYTLCLEEKHLISTCDENQPQDNIAEESKAMCSTDKSALSVFPESMNGMGYANIYCYLCNKRSVIMCDLEDTRKATKANANFLIFLDISPLIITDEEDSKAYRCSHAEVNDNFFDVCRPIHCPLFNVPVFGICTSLVASSQLNYGFSFKLVQMAPNSWHQSEIHDFVIMLFKPLSEKLRIEQCSMCGVTVKRENGLGILNSTDTFFLQLVLTTSLRCKIEHVLSVADSLEKQIHSSKTFALFIGNVQILIKYVSSYENYEKISMNSEKVLETGRCPFLSPSRFDNCPKIALTINEYDILANKSEVYKYQTARNQHNHFEICYDDYQSLIESITNNYKEGKPIYTPIIVGAVLILWFIKSKTVVEIL